MSANQGEGRVVVVVPRRLARTSAVNSQLMAAAHLTRGFEMLVGPERVLLVTEEGPTTATAVLARAVVGGASAPAGRWSGLPPAVRVPMGDVQALLRRRHLRDLRVEGPLSLVIQFHHRFQDVGFRLARENACPLIVRIEALEVAEQRDWGFRRPLLGPLVTAMGEGRLLRRADLVSPVSPDLAQQVLSAGVPSRRVLILPNGVDLDLFQPITEGQAFLPEDLHSRFLVGWAGGFRPYHGLAQVENLVRLLERRLPDATLCLVGTGPLRAHLDGIAARHPESLRLLPPIAQHELPRLLQRFDVCLQLAEPGSAQHYSPLKVLEYLACGRPVVAPTGGTTSYLTDGRDALLYPPGDLERLVDQVERLQISTELGIELGRAGRATAEGRGGWVRVAEQMAAAVELELVVS